jgi:hypothetical protein
MSAPSFLQRFVTTFLPVNFCRLARQVGWLKRQGKIDAFEFLIASVLGQLSALRQTLVAQSLCFTLPVTRQAVDQRYTAEAVAYFQAAFAEVLALSLEGPTSLPAQQLREHFSAVHLVDSTAFDCPECLAELFPACGGAGSRANLKVLLSYDLVSGRLEPLRLLPGKRSDQGQALGLCQRLQAGHLQINDKGFFDAKAWHAAADRGAYLLMPLPHGSTLWLCPQALAPERSLNLAAALAHQSEDRVEWPELFLGKPGPHRYGPVRLVAFRLSPQSAARHRAGLRESMRKQGRTPTAEALELIGWLLLVTNAPAQKLPSACMAYVYRLRWQIELIFRQAKSVLRLDRAENNNLFRVQCEVWARLSAAVLVFWWHAHANAQCWQQHRSEISFEKLCRLIQTWGLTLARSFRQGANACLEVLRPLWGQVMVNARKGRQKSRTNSWDRLLAQWLDPQPPMPTAINPVRMTSTPTP